MQIINPAVRSAAEQFTDGKVSDQTLANVAAMNGLPLYVDRPVPRPDERAVAEREVTQARAALKSAIEGLAWVERGKAVFDAQNNGPGDFRHGKFPIRVREAQDALVVARTRADAAELEWARVQA